MAVSARRSSSCGATIASALEAIPMLAPTCNTCRSTSTGRQIDSSICRANSFAQSVACSSMMRIANSSPPTRASLVFFGHKEIKRSLNVQINASPAWCPCASLIPLNPSKSMKIIAKLSRLHVGSCERRSRHSSKCRRLGRPLNASVSAICLFSSLNFSVSRWRFSKSCCDFTKSEKSLL